MSRVKSISFKDSLEVDDVLRKAQDLADRDLDSFSEIVYQALKEYVKKHYPGNPQTPIDLYSTASTDTPPPNQEGDKYTCPLHGRYDECWRR